MTLPLIIFFFVSVRPTDPKEAPKGSIRRMILENYESLGLQAKPDNSDNGVHASASPFEGLAEKMNWLNIKPKDDPFGKALLNEGISKRTIEKWCKDPQLELSATETGSIFDTLEELDADTCLRMMVDLNKLN